LGEGRDEGLEEGGVLSVVSSELLEDLVVSGLDLGEGDTMNHVLDQLNTLLESGDLDLGLVVLISPLLVLGVSLGGTGFDGLNGLIVILVGLFETLLGSGEDVSVVGNGVLEGGDGLGLVLDLLLETTEGLVTGGLVGLVVSVSLTLVTVKLSGDFVQKKDDFLLRGLGSNVQGDSGDESLTEMVLIDLSEDGLGVLELSVGDLGSGEHQQNSQNDELVHL